VPTPNTKRVKISHDIRKALEAVPDGDDEEESFDFGLEVMPVPASGEPEDGSDSDQPPTGGGTVPLATELDELEVDEKAFFTPLPIGLLSEPVR
jgi:hypothetical protein